MNLLILVICVLVNEITAKSIKLNATCFSNEQLNNITDFSKENYELDTNEQLKYAESKQEIKIESEERKLDSDTNERSNDNNTEIHPTIRHESKKCNTDIDCKTNTGLNLNEADYKYTINTDDRFNEDKPTNVDTLKTQSAKINIRELRSELLNHLLEYFLNIIKEEKHSETRKKYNKDEMKLEDKLRNYYHSDLDHLFHNGNLDMDQKDTEYPSKERQMYSSGLFQAVGDGSEYPHIKRQIEGKDKIVDKETEDSDIKHLNSTENIQQVELEGTKLEVASQESNEYGLAGKESVENSTMRIKDNLTVSHLVSNKENFLLNIKNTEVTTEHANPTQNTTGINYVDGKKMSDSSDYKPNEDSLIDMDNFENSKEINNEHTNTRMRQFFVGFNKNDDHKTSSECSKHNYIIQLNIQI